MENSCVVVYEVLIKPGRSNICPKTVGYWKICTILTCDILLDLTKESGRISKTLQFVHILSICGYRILSHPL